MFTRFAAHSLLVLWRARLSVALETPGVPLACAVLCVLFLGVASCGGGGGGGGGAYVSPANSQVLTEVSAADANVDQGAGDFVVNLRWRFPVTRLNGEALAAEDIRGHIIIYFSETDLATNAAGTLGERIGSRQAFFSSREDLGHFIASQDLPELVATGLPNIILVQAPQSTFRFEGSGQQTYYFAVSAYDWYGLYSPLSETVKVVP